MSLWLLRELIRGRTPFFLSILTAPVSSVVLVDDSVASARRCAPASERTSPNRTVSLSPRAGAIPQSHQADHPRQAIWTSRPPTQTAATKPDRASASRPRAARSGPPRSTTCNSPPFSRFAHARDCARRSVMPPTDTAHPAPRKKTALPQMPFPLSCPVHVLRIARV